MVLIKIDGKCLSWNTCYITVNSSVLDIFVPAIVRIASLLYSGGNIAKHGDRNATRCEIFTDRDRSCMSRKETITKAGRPVTEEVGR